MNRISKQASLRKSHGVTLHANQIIGWIAIVLSGISAWSRNGLAQSRDLDGSKMQAKQVELGHRVQDSVQAPDDLTDWFYVSFSDHRRVVIEVGASQPVDLRLVDSANKKVWGAPIGTTPVTVTMELGPGIYFVVVTPGSNDSKGKEILRPYWFRIRAP